MTRIRSIRRAALLALTFPVFAGAQTTDTAGALKYPVSIKANQVDYYHGVKVADPYRGLEDPDSPQTKAWVQAQNALTFGYLEAIPERVTIRNRLTQMWNYPRFDAPEKSGGRYFQFQNTGLQNQSVLYVRNGNGPWRVLLDPNTLAADGTVALNASEPSPDGRHLAYATTVSGSDWQEIRVRNVDTRRDLPEQLKWVKFSDISWTRDNKGFFYQRYDEPKTGNTLTNVNRGQKVYYHRINTPQSRDELVFEQRDQPDWLFDTQVTEDGKFAIITVYQGTDQRTRLYYLFLGDNGKKPNINVPIVRLIDRLEAEYQFIGNMGDVFLVRTDRTAPRGRVVSIDINNAQPNRWLTVIGEGKDALTDAKIIGSRLVVSYLQDARSSVRFYGMPTDRDLRDVRRAPVGDPRGEFRESPCRKGSIQRGAIWRAAEWDIHSSGS